MIRALGLLLLSLSVFSAVLMVYFATNVPEIEVYSRVHPEACDTLTNPSFLTAIQITEAFPRVFKAVVSEPKDGDPFVLDQWGNEGKVTFLENGWVFAAANLRLRYTIRDEKINESSTCILNLEVWNPNESIGLKSYLSRRVYRSALLEFR